MPNMELKTLLKKNLDGAKKIAVLGIGSELRADDVAGMLVAKRVEEKCAKRTGDCPEMRVFYGATAPENLTGEIKKYQPTNLVIVDAADTSAAPGTITFIKPDELLQISFTTHMMPLKVMVDYLLESFKCQVTVLGIQPKVLSFGKATSKEVERSVRQVADSLSEVLKTL